MNMHPSLLSLDRAVDLNIVYLLPETGTDRVVQDFPKPNCMDKAATQQMVHSTRSNWSIQSTSRITCPALTVLREVVQACLLLLLGTLCCSRQPPEDRARVSGGGRRGEERQREGGYRARKGRRRVDKVVE